MQLAAEYQILQGTHDALVGEFENLRGFRRLKIPAEFERLEGVYGTKNLFWEAFAFTAESIVYGRVVLIRGVDCWINNIIVFPADGATIPILGLEMLGFRNKIHLIVADAFPLIESDADLMNEIGAKYDDIGETPPMPEWAAKIFSPRPIFRKPRNEDDITTAANAMREVGALWLAKARTATHSSDATETQSAAARRDEYVRRHAADEPAEPFLRRCFGDSVAQRLVHEFLFPADWRKVNPDDFQ